MKEEWKKKQPANQNSERHHAERQPSSEFDEKISTTQSLTHSDVAGVSVEAAPPDWRPNWQQAPHFCCWRYRCNGRIGSQ